MIKDCVISYFIGETACIETRIHVNLSRSQYFYQLIRFFSEIQSIILPNGVFGTFFSKRENFDMSAVLDNFEGILFSFRYLWGVCLYQRHKVHIYRISNWPCYVKRCVYWAIYICVSVYPSCTFRRAKNPL